MIARVIRKNSTKEYAIIFSYIQEDAITLHHYQIIAAHNPNVDIFPISLISFLNASDCRTNPFYERVKAFEGDSSQAWRDCDLLLYAAFCSIAENHYERYVYLEWDCLCKAELKNFFLEVWHYNAAASSIRLQNREPEWNWFREKEQLPLEFQSFAMGIVPFSVSMFSKKALEGVINVLRGKHIQVFAELRIATVLNYLGYPPVPNPRAGHTITWMPLLNTSNSLHGIFHPVKHL